MLSPEFISYCASVIAEARSAGGRCLVLVPAYSDAEQLAPVLPEVLLHRQGSPLKPLLDAYRATENACLVTPAGWVGLDLPGLVQRLVISRLPFPPRVDETGEVFSSALGTMLMKLSQGIGRAIRRPNDVATLWFADPRMPPPGILLDRTLMAPHSLANGILGQQLERCLNALADLSTMEPTTCLSNQACGVSFQSWPRRVNSI
jgi:ATP-dependent DNA helicase DinG